MNRIILSLIMIVSVATIAHAEDWRSWVQRRSVEVEQEREARQRAKCVQVDLDLDKAMLRLAAAWSASGPSNETRYIAEEAREIAGLGLQRDCDSELYSRSWQELRNLERALSEYGIKKGE